MVVVVKLPRTKSRLEDTVLKEKNWTFLTRNKKESQCASTTTNIIHL